MYEIDIWSTLIPYLYTNTLMAWISIPMHWLCAYPWFTFLFFAPKPFSMLFKLENTVSYKGVLRFHSIIFTHGWFGSVFVQGHILELNKHRSEINDVRGSVLFFCSRVRLDLREWSDRRARRGSGDWGETPVLLDLLFPLLRVWVSNLHFNYSLCFIMNLRRSQSRKTYEWKVWVVC